jgi:Skp family chaperone for outer membrane proteins
VEHEQDVNRAASRRAIPREWIDMPFSSRLAWGLGLSTLGLGLGLGVFVTRSQGQAPSAQDKNVQRTTSNSGQVRVFPAPLCGTIDVDQVMKKYEKVTKQMKELEDEAKVKEGELARIEALGRQTLEKRDTFTQDSPQYSKLNEELMGLKVKLDSTKENAEREFKQRFSNLMISSYREIDEMTRLVAKSHQLTVVYKYIQQPSDKSNQMALKSWISQEIIYADPRYDVTAEVTMYLNNRYAREQAAAGGRVETQNAKAAPAARSGQR